MTVTTAANRVNGPHVDADFLDEAYEFLAYVKRAHRQRVRRRMFVVGVLVAVVVGLGGALMLQSARREARLPTTPFSAPPAPREAVSPESPLGAQKPVSAESPALSPGAAVPAVEAPPPRRHPWKAMPSSSRTHGDDLKELLRAAAPRELGGLELPNTPAIDSVRDDAGPEN
jgi:cell division protein FtsN